MFILDNLSSVVIYGSCIIHVFHLFLFFILILFLQHQIETIVLFLLEQQGLLASRIAKLGERHDALQHQPDISQISELREAYRQVGRDLLKLLFFVEINAIGLRKILKKFDKRFGYRFTDYYVKTRANHPYSQLQQVFKHVVICLIKAFSATLSFYTFQNLNRLDAFCYFHSTMF